MGGEIDALPDAVRHAASDAADRRLGYAESCRKLALSLARGTDICNIVGGKQSQGPDLLWQTSALSCVAGAVGKLNIRWLVCTTSCERDDVVEIRRPLDRFTADAAKVASLLRKVVNSHVSDIGAKALRPPHHRSVKNRVGVLAESFGFALSVDFGRLPANG